MTERTGTDFPTRSLREVAEAPLITIGGSVGDAEWATGLRGKWRDAVNSAAVLQKMRATARDVAASCR